MLLSTHLILAAILNCLPAGGLILWVILAWMHNWLSLLAWGSNLSCVICIIYQSWAIKWQWWAWLHMWVAGGRRDCTVISITINNLCLMDWMCVWSVFVCDTLLHNKIASKNRDKQFSMWNCADGVINTWWLMAGTVGLGSMVISMFKIWQNYMIDNCLKLPVRKIYKISIQPSCKNLIEYVRF